MRTGTSRHDRYRARVNIRLNMEPCEPRMLLAADLAISVEPFELESAGEEVTRIVRVANNGSEDAEDVVLRSLLSDQIEGATWERAAGLADFVHRESPVAKQLQTIRSLQNAYVDLPTAIGDVNGDGMLDYYVEGDLLDLFTTRDEDLHFIVFGRNGTTELGEIPRESGNYDSPDGVFIEGAKPAWNSITNVGDLNGDSIDDIQFNETIIFGSTSLGTTGPINLNRPVEPNFRFDRETTILAHQSEDFNADGVKDVIVGQQVYLGNETSESQGVLTVDPDTQQAVQLPFEAYSATNAGDVNGDGFDDFGFGFHVVLGGPEHFRSGGEIAFAELKPTLRDGWGGESHAINAGDVNGDGIDDLIYSMFGPISHGTASDKGLSFVRHGIHLVYGSPTIVDSGVIDVASAGLTFQLVSNYYSRASAYTEDVNGDGVLDIGLSVPNRELIVFGGPELRDMDFGHQDNDRVDDLSHVFDGQNGFALEPLSTSSYWERIQSIGDSSILIQEDSSVRTVDTFHISALDVPASYAPPSDFIQHGSGDILEPLTIPAGESFTYRVTGTLKVNALPAIRSSAVSASTAPSRAAAALPRQTSVDLEVKVAHTPIVVGEQATMEVLIGNNGLHTASAVAIQESLSTSLQDASWTFETSRLFPDDISEWPTLVPSVNGFSAEFAPGRDITSGRYEAYGSEMSLLGDVNGDGFEDFFVNDTIYFGSENFGRNGMADAFAPVSVLTYAWFPNIGD